MTDKKWNLENYSSWIDGKWKINHNRSLKDLFFLLTFNNILVINGSEVLECYSLTKNKNEMMVCHKERTLVFYTQCQASGLKFKVLFKTIAEVEECIQELKKFINDIRSYDGTKKDEQKKEVAKKEETYSEMLSKLMKSGFKSHLPAPSSIPDDYPNESAVTLCILEPGFSKFVHDIEKIITLHKENETN